jgi:hypothetical protein
VHTKPQLAGQDFVMCRIVHYVSPHDGKQYPFILTFTKNPQVFPRVASGVVLGRSVSLPAELLENIPYDATKKPGTWHFSAHKHTKRKKGPQPGKPLVDPAKIRNATAA